MLYLLIIFIFAFGLIIGSFLNCLIWRLHQGEGMFPVLLGGRGKNRSYCPKCKHQIAWFDNIPILSFMMLGGKCRHCRKPISWQYPIVEFITGLLFVIAFLINTPVTHPLPLPGGDLLRDWFLISIMIVVFVYDLRWYLILDVVVLPACLVVFVLNLILGFSWHNLLISGIIGGSFFLVQFLISKGKWIGGGDIRLGVLMGLALGWPKIIASIFLAYFIGSIIAIGLLIAGKKKWGSKLPLGVFLSVATVVVLFWGEKIIEWYMDVMLF